MTRPRIALSATHQDLCNSCKGQPDNPVWYGPSLHYDVVYCGRCGIILRFRGGEKGGKFDDLDLIKPDGTVTTWYELKNPTPLPAPYRAGACLAVHLPDGDWGAALVLAAKDPPDVGPYQYGSHIGSNLVGLLRYKGREKPDLNVFLSRDWLEIEQSDWSRQKRMPAAFWCTGEYTDSPGSLGDPIVLGHVDIDPDEVDLTAPWGTSALGASIDAFYRAESPAVENSPAEDVVKQLPKATLLRVLVRPEDYHGQQVYLKGIVELRYDEGRYTGAALYLSFEDFRFHRHENAVWFNLPKAERKMGSQQLRERYHGQQGSVSGVVDATGACVSADRCAPGWGCALDAATGIHTSHPEEATLSREATFLRKLLLQDQQAHCRMLYQNGPLACPHCGNADRDLIRLVERPLTNSGFHLIKVDMSFFICQHCGRSFGKDWPIWPAW